MDILTLLVLLSTLYSVQALECSVAPGNVQASAVNSTAIRVTWDPPMHMSCDPSTLHYQVQYKAGENGWPMSTEITIDTVITVTGLLPNTSYIFQVRVLGQDLKVLRSSEEISKATPEGVPGPVNISLIPFFHQIICTWTIPSMPNGKIQKYIVEYWPTDDPENVMNESRTDTSGKVSVKGLAGGTEYNFTVRAYTSRGAGELSSAVASTHKRLPPVEGLHVYIVNDTAVNVSWQLYNALDITIDGYTVEYFLLSESCESGLVRARTSPQSAGSQHFSSNDSENFDVIGGLTPGSRYDFEVFLTATRDGIELMGEPASHEIIDLPGGEETTRDINMKIKIAVAVFVPILAVVICILVVLCTCACYRIKSVPTIAVTEKNPAYALKKKSSDQEDNSDYECVTEDCLDGQETTSNIAYQLMNSKEGLTHESTFAESSDGHYLTLKKSTLNQQQVVGTARVN